MSLLSSWFCFVCFFAIIGILVLNHRTSGKWLSAKQSPIKHYWYSDDVGRVQTPTRGEKGTRWIEDTNSLSNAAIARVASERKWGIFKGGNV